MSSIYRSSIQSGSFTPMYSSSAFFRARGLIIRALLHNQQQMLSYRITITKKHIEKNISGLYCTIIHLINRIRICYQWQHYQILCVDNTDYWYRQNV